MLKAQVKILVYEVEPPDFLPQDRKRRNLKSTSNSSTRRNGSAPSQRTKLMTEITTDYVIPKPYFISGPGSVETFHESLSMNEIRTDREKANPVQRAQITRLADTVSPPSSADVNDVHSKPLAALNTSGYTRISSSGSHIRTTEAISPTRISDASTLMNVSLCQTPSSPSSTGPSCTQNGPSLGNQRQQQGQSSTASSVSCTPPFLDPETRTSVQEALQSANDVISEMSATIHQLSSQLHSLKNSHKEEVEDLQSHIVYLESRCEEDSAQIAELLRSDLAAQR